MTKEYVIIPEPRRVPGHNWLTGFGYLPSTNEYKVVSMYRGYSDNSVHIMLYTLGRRNGWRTVAKFHSGFHNFTSGQGVFLNGALYWVKDRSGTIAVFDLVDENFREQLPLSGSSVGGIGVLGGFLICSTIYVNRNYMYRYHDAWIYSKGNDTHDTIEQEEQSQSLGWTREFRLRYEGLSDFTKSGDVLSYSSKSLDIYDPVTSTSKKLLDFSTDQQFCKVFPHKHTLVSLRELGEKDTRIMEFDEIEDAEIRH